MSLDQIIEETLPSEQAHKCPECSSVAQHRIAGSGFRYENPEGQDEDMLPAYLEFRLSCVHCPGSWWETYVRTDVTN